jgi:hypothetical protein
MHSYLCLPNRNQASCSACQIEQISPTGFSDASAFPRPARPPMPRGRPASDACNCTSASQLQRRHPSSLIKTLCRTSKGIAVRDALSHDAQHVLQPRGAQRTSTRTSIHRCKKLAGSTCTDRQAACSRSGSRRNGRDAYTHGTYENAFRVQRDGLVRRTP